MKGNKNLLQIGLDKGEHYKHVWKTKLFNYKLYKRKDVIKIQKEINNV
jgi:hypothetical protein